MTPDRDLRELADLVREMFDDIAATEAHGHRLPIGSEELRVYFRDLLQRDGVAVALAEARRRYVQQAVTRLFALDDPKRVVHDELDRRQ